MGRLHLGLSDAQMRSAFSQNHCVSRTRDCEGVKQLPTSQICHVSPSDVRGERSLDDASPLILNSLPFAALWDLEFYETTPPAGAAVLDK
jgi:hypothetical protein